MNWKKWILLAFIAATHLLNAAGLEDPKGYATHSNLQWNWALKAIEKYPWTGTEKVLDIGCGDGKISALISKKHTKAPVIGLDISESMIRFASSSFSSKDYLNLLFQKGDISFLPFHEQFDLIVSFCSLHFVIEQETGLKHIHDSLLPEGKLLIVVPGRDNTSVANISETLILSEKWAPYFPSFKKQRVYFTQEDYHALFIQSGFELIYFDVSHDQVRFPNRSALIDWLRPIVNYISHLSSSLQEEFLADLANIMLLSALPTQDDSVLLESSLFECLYQKQG